MCELDKTLWQHGVDAATNRASVTFQVNDSSIAIEIAGNKAMTPHFFAAAGADRSIPLEIFTLCGYFSQ